MKNNTNLKRDIILLTIYTFSLTLYGSWCVVYPYLVSYLKHFNPELSLKTLFSTTIGLFIGQSVANLLLPSFYFFFGIKNTILLSGFFNLINCLLFIYFDNFYTILLNTTLTGLIYHLAVTSLTYYLTEKYDNGYIYSYKCYVGLGFSNIIWAFLAVKIINPENIGMIAKNIVNGQFEYYFPWEISKNFPTLMIIIGIVNFLITVIPISFIKDPEHIKVNFLIWIKAKLMGNKRALNELSKEYSKNKSLSKSLNLSNHSLINISQNKEEQNEKKAKLIKNNDEENNKNILTDTEAKEKSYKIMFSPLFLLLVLILTIQVAPVYYFIDNYKYIAYQVIKNDTLMSLSISLQCISSIICQFFFNSIWNKFGFFQTYNIISTILIIFHVVYLLFSVRSSFFMILNSIVNRIATQFLVGAISFTKFGLFQGKVAVYIGNVVDLSFSFAMILGIIFNYLFFSQEDISTIFVVFFILNCFAAFLFRYFYRDFEEKMKKFN